MRERHPVRVDGQVAGELTVEREGLWTVFSLRCRDPGRLLRLSVYGGGHEGYLGVPAPEDGELRLRRRLSRQERSALPEAIEYAGEAGAGRPPPPPVPSAPPAGAPGPASEPEPLPGRATETLWYAVGDGTLYTRTAEGAWRAVPMTGGVLPEGAAARRRIEGVDYAVFPLRPGRPPL